MPELNERSLYCILCTSLFQANIVDPDEISILSLSTLFDKKPIYGLPVKNAKKLNVMYFHGCGSLVSFLCLQILPFFY